MPTSSIYRVRSVSSGIPGAPFLTTTYFDANQGTPQQAVSAMGNFWDDIWTRMHEDITVTVQGTVDEVDPVSGAIQAQHSASQAVISGFASDSLLSLGTQAQLNLNTGVFVNGRQIRGKLYVPGVTEVSNEGGLPTGALGTTMIDGYGAIQSATGAELVVYSPTYGRWEAIGNAIPSSYFARLKSRQR